MKVRDSGMPDEAMWTQLFDARRILADLDFPAADADVVDFGCGYGTFAVAAARLTSRTVCAFDIDAAMIEATAAKAASFGLDNVKAVERDLVAHGTGLPDVSTDYAMLFNILHAEDPVSLLREALRVLRPYRQGLRDPLDARCDDPSGPELIIRLKSSRRRPP